MTCPQCPQIKLSPPVPDIRLSVRRIERLSVVTEPTGIMGMVAILFPPDVMVFETASPENRARSTRLPRMPHFCPGGGGAGAKNRRAPRPCDEARTVPYKCYVEHPLDETSELL